MKLRILLFYTAFVAMASIMAIVVDDARDINTTHIAQKINAENTVSSEGDVRATSCAIDARCPDCNIVLLSVDSLRADHVGAYGYERETTPYFDALAKKGVLFENYFSTSFLTPVSEMSVHTGMYPTAHKTTNFDTVLPEDITTLAQYFKQKGYATSALLSSPEFEINPALRKSFSRGFERYEYLEEVQRAFPTREQVEEEIDTFSDKKFFWWVGVGGVHWPYGAQGPNVFADETYSGIFQNKPLEWWSVFQNIYEGVQYPEQVSVEDADIQYVIDQYDNGVRAFDEFLERFMNELTRRNLLDRTIIIIQSEHGEDLHEHGYFAHYDILDTQTHVPLLVLFPRLDTECRITSFAGSVDVFPTIVDVLGYPPLDQFQGTSLAPIIHGSEKDGARQEVFLERSPLWEETFSISASLKNRGIETGSERHKDIGIRTPRWKYISRTSKQAMEKIQWWRAVTGKKVQFPEEELYDLVSDPGEKKNVIGQYPDEAAALRKKLQSWFEKISPPSQNTDTEPVIQPYF